MDVIRAFGAPHAAVSVAIEAHVTATIEVRCGSKHGQYENQVLSIGKIT